MVICLERGANLHMAQLMPLPLTVSCFSKIKIGFTFLVPAHLVVPEKGRETGVCVKTVNLRISYHGPFSINYRLHLPVRQMPMMLNRIRFLISDAVEIPNLRHLLQTTE